MPREERRVELLIGCRVVDANGDVVGRLEEIVVEYVEEEYRVREYHVGAFAAVERLVGGPLRRGLLRLIGGHRVHRGYVVPWHLMDLSDAERPRVSVPKAELRHMDEMRDASSPARATARPPHRRSA